MKDRIDPPVNPLLIGGTAFVLLGGTVALHRLGICDWRCLWDCWTLLLVLVG